MTKNEFMEIVNEEGLKIIIYMVKTILDLMNQF